MTEPTTATKTFRLGPWMRHRTDDHAGMYEPAPDAPHKAVDTIEWGHPVNQYRVVWLDAGHEHPQRVLDADGCTAVVWEAEHD